MCQCIFWWLTSLCHRRLASRLCSKSGPLFLKYSLYSKERKNWNKISYFLTNRSLSVRQDSRKKKKKIKLRDSKFDRIPKKNPRPPRLPTAKGVCVLLPRRSSRSIFEYLFVFVSCFNNSSHRVCVCVCLLFLHLDYFLFVWSSTRAMFVSTWNIFSPFFFHHSSFIKFLLNTFNRI